MCKCNQYIKGPYCGEGECKDSSYSSLSEIVSQLESCGFTCEAGPLELNTAFQALKKRSEQKGLFVEVNMTELNVFQRLLDVIHKAAITTNDEHTRSFLKEEIADITTVQERR